MTFTIFSFAFLLLFATCMLLCIFKGIKSGFVKTAISLASMVASFFISTMIAQKLSDVFAEDIAQPIYGSNLLGNLNAYSEQVDNLVYAYVDALITPFVFLPIFFAVYAIINLGVKIVYNTKLKPTSEDTEYELEGQDASAYNHNSKLLGGILGGVCGILTAVMITFPIMGTLDFAYMGSAFLDPDSGAMYVYNETDDENINAVRFYAKDAMGNMIYAMGGKPIYNFVARSKINGVNVGIMSEMKKTTVTTQKLMTVLNEISTGKVRTSKQFKAIEEVRGEIKDSETLKILVSEFMSSAADCWIDGDTMMGISRPITNGAVDPFVDEILLLLKTSTVETTADDLATVLRVCVILLDNDISSTNSDYADVLLEMDENDMIYDLKTELEGNFRTKYLADTISQIALRTTSFAIKTNTRGNYNAFIRNLTDEINRVKLQNYDVQSAHVASTFKKEMRSFGITVPESIASIVADELTKRHCRYLRETTTDEVKAFFDSYT